jgi:hypothetical protein
VADTLLAEQAICPRQSHAAVSDKHPHCKFWVSLLAMHWAVVLAVVLAVRSPARVGLNRSKLTIIIIVVNPQVSDRKKAEQEVLLKSFVFSIIFCVIFLVCYFGISSTKKMLF